MMLYWSEYKGHPVEKYKNKDLTIYLNGKTLTAYRNHRSGLTVKDVSTLTIDGANVVIKGEGKVALVTYIRTDSTRISDEAAAAAKAHILSEYGSDFLPNHKRIYKNN